MNNLQELKNKYFTDLKYFQNLQSKVGLVEEEEAQTYLAIKVKENIIRCEEALCIIDSMEKRCA